MRYFSEIIARICHCEAKPKQSLFSLIIIALFLFFPSPLFAEIKEIIAEGAYNMGDGETPSVAESRALLQEKRLALEQAGTYVESYSKVKNFQLTEDEIKVLASGIMEVEILDKKRTVIGDGIHFWIKIKTKVNPDKIEDMAKKVKEKSVVEDYKKIQESYDKSQREIEELRKQLAQTKDEMKRRQIVEKIINDESLFQANDWFEKGKKLGLDEKYDESIEAFTAAITLNPIHAEAYNSRGASYYNKGQYEKALNDFSRAITINPNLVKAYINRGITYLKRHQYDKAIEDFNKAITLDSKDPNLAKAYYFRGAAYTNLNSIKSAISDFQKACDMGDADGCKALRDPDIARFIDDTSAKRTNIITIPLSKLTNLITQNKTLKGHSNYVYSLAFSPDGKILASGSEDKTIILWDATTGEKIKILKGHSAGVISVSFSQDGKMLASMSKEGNIIFGRKGTIILWDVATGEKIKTFDNLPYNYAGDGNYSIGITSTGNIILLGIEDNNIIFWDVTVGNKIPMVKFGNLQPVYSNVDITPDFKTIAFGDVLCDRVTGKYKTVPLGTVYSVALTPDGKTLVAGGEITITFMSVGDIINYHPLFYNRDEVQKDIITTIYGRPSGAVRNILLKLLTNEQDAVYSGPVYSVAFNRDASMLASGSADKNIILWDTPVIHLSSLITIKNREADISGIVKGEFETSKEYEARIKKFVDYIKEERDRAEEKLKEIKDKFNYPYSFRINNIGKYDADRGGFEVDIFSNKILIPIPREKATYIINHEDNLLITGMLRYFDSEKAELVNAFLVDETTNEQFPFGKHTE